MAEESESLKEYVGIITVFNIIGIMFIVTSLVLYGFVRDYLIYEVYQIYLQLQTNGAIGIWIEPAYTALESTLNVIPTVLDYMFLFLFVALCISVSIGSYKSSRIGWFSSLGFLTIGILFSMLIMGIMKQIGDWLQLNFITNLFPELSLSLPFFNFYMEWMFLINTILIVVCIVLNFIDLDLQGFEQRKDKERISNDEMN